MNEWRPYEPCRERIRGSARTRAITSDDPQLYPPLVTVPNAATPEDTVKLPTIVRAIKELRDLLHEEAKLRVLERRAREEARQRLAPHLKLPDSGSGW